MASRHRRALHGPLRADEDGSSRRASRVAEHGAPDRGAGRRVVQPVPQARARASTTITPSAPQCGQRFPIEDGIPQMFWPHETIDDPARRHRDGQGVLRGDAVSRTTTITIRSAR